MALVCAKTSVTDLVAIVGGDLFALAGSDLACACVRWPGGPGLHWCALALAALVSALVSAETCLALVCNDLGGTSVRNELGCTCGCDDLGWKK